MSKKKIKNSRRLKVLNSDVQTHHSTVNFCCERMSVVNSRTITEEGYLRLSASIFRTGIFDFYVGEFETEDLPEQFKNVSPDTLMRGYISDEELKSASFISSSESLPVTDGHPPSFLNSRNISLYQRGTLLGKAKPKKKKAGDMSLLTLEADLLVTDSDLVNEIMEAGKEGVSIGKRADFYWEPGSDSAYGEYDFSMKNLVLNHVAVVWSPRGGNLTVLHEKPNGAENDPKELNGMKVIRVINGIKVEFSDQAAQAFDTVAKEKEALETKVSEMETQFAQVEAERDNLKDKLEKASSAEVVNARVKERVALLNSAQKLYAEVDCEADDNEIRLQVINHAKPDLDLKGKSVEYVKAMFDILTEENKGLSDIDREVINSTRNVSNGGSKDEGKLAAAMRKREDYLKQRQAEFAQGKKGLN